MLRYPVGSRVVPGDRLASVGSSSSSSSPTTSCEAGQGTYVRSGHVYASLCGTVEVHVAAKTRTTRVAGGDGDGDGNGGDGDGDGGGGDGNGGGGVVRVVRVVPPGHRPRRTTIDVGNLVLGKVLRVAHGMAAVDVVAVSVPLPSPASSASPSSAASLSSSSSSSSSSFVALAESYPGVIRREDVRANASEEVDVRDAFVPGDLLLARVVSVGDGRRVGLSTAEEGLGKEKVDEAMLLVPGR